MKSPAVGILAVAVGALLGHPAANAQAISGHPARSRVFLGAFGGRVVHSSESSLRGANQNGSAAWGGFTAGYEGRLTDRLSIQIPTSVSWGSTGRAVEAGYGLRRFEVGLAPRTLLRRLALPVGELQLHLSGQGGLSFDKTSPPARRAFDEKIDDGVGWYAGAGAAVTWLQKSLGATLEVAYRQTRTPEHSTITPFDPAVPTVIEDRRYVDHQIVFTFAGVFAF